MLCRTRGRPRSVRVAVAVGFASVVASCTPLQAHVAVLSHDSLAGRDNGTPGSASARSWLIDRLDDIAVGANPHGSGTAAYEQPFSGGTNVVAVIPGGDLADEYVVIGAHYDHLGSACDGSGASDSICNGATDNAAGAAAVLEIGRALAERDEPPRRSIVLAFWDREEDGLLGSQYYVQHPLVPLADTVAYLNYDIQGANLLPGLRATSFAVAAESGGSELQEAVAAAAGVAPLRLHRLSSVFGQGRSDYVRFLTAQVPSVFFTDSTGPCYHTVDDEFGVVDFTKLEHQVAIGVALATDLADRDARLTFTASSPLATYADAVELAQVLADAADDLGRFTPAQQQQLLAYRATVEAIVAAGPEQFDSDDVTALLTGAVTAVGILSTGPCDGFLAAG